MFPRFDIEIYDDQTNNVSKFLAKREKKKGRKKERFAFSRPEIVIGLGDNHFDVNFGATRSK